MRDNYDFTGGKKNPYAEKLKGKYTVMVHYDTSNPVAEKKEEPPKPDTDDKRPQKRA